LEPPVCAAAAYGGGGDGAKDTGFFTSPNYYNDSGADSVACGPIIINEAKAIAGGITPGDDPGFPITISKPGVYQLAG